MKRLKLGWQLLIALSALAVAVAVVSGLTTRAVEKVYLEGLATDQAREKLDVVLSSSIDLIVSEDLPGIETMARQLLAEDRSLVSLRIVNEARKELYNSSRSPPGNHGSLLRMSRDVVVEGENFGTITLGWDTKNIDQAIAHHALQIAIYVGIASIVLGFVIYLALIMLLVKPIDAIAHQALGFGRGRFDPPKRLSAWASAEIERLFVAVGALGQLMELSELRQAELRAAMNIANAANSAKSNFLANMSHELRTPLNAILGFSQIIEGETLGKIGNRKYAEYAKDIRESGDHLLAIINEILDMSKIEAGKLELGAECCDLDQILKESLTVACTGAVGSTNDIQVEIAEDLPLVRGDSRRFKQVFINLLSNAFKFTPEGGMVKLSASWRPEEGVTVSVTDTGRGIPQEDIERVLKPFEQIEEAFSRSTQGTGLGLPLAKSLVELQGGHFDLTSVVGTGTRATVVLPPEIFIAGEIDDPEDSDGAYSKAV